MPKTVINRLPAYIGFDDTLSTVVDTGTDYVVGIIMPDVWTAARVSIQLSTDGAQYYDLFDWNIGELIFNVTPGAAVAIDPNRLLMARYLKLRSGTREEPIPQQETCTFTVITVDAISG